MKRGDLYLVKKPSPHEPKRRRAFVVVSRQILIDSDYSTVVCAPVYSRYSGLATQVETGPKEGLKHDSAVHCDGLVSLPKSTLTDYIGSLSGMKIDEIDRALRIALSVE